MAKAKAKAKSKIKTKPKPKAKAKTKVAPKTKATAAKSSALTPLDDRLLVEVQLGEKRTAGGLYIPDTAQVSGNFQGRVLTIGRGHKNKKGHVRPMDVRPGDTILFSEFSGDKMQLDGKEVRILRESEVLGIVEK